MTLIRWVIIRFLRIDVNDGMILKLDQYYGPDKWCFFDGMVVYEWPRQNGSHIVDEICDVDAMHYYVGIH